MIVKSIDEILGNRPCITIDRETCVSKAVDLMEANDVDVVVVTDGKTMCGILSAEDITRRWLARGLVAEATHVHEIMTPNPVSVRRQTSVGEALGKMLDKTVRQLPVLDRAGDVVGLLSLRDIPTEYRLMVERLRARRQPIVE
ncbi:MAG: CBS domain-containing protein [Paracoccaceae bacterium]